MRPSGDRKGAFVEKMGTVTIDMDAYEKRGTDMEVLRMVIDKIEDLPPLPLIVHKILSLTQDEKSNTSELAKALSNDQALTAKILRIANSPLYHVSSVVTSISHAVALLGFRAIRNLALGLSTMEMFHESSENHFLPRQRFWEHSLACGHCCKALAGCIHHRLPDEAFVGGLLHDIGRMVFDHFFPETFRSALKQAYMTRRPLLDLEREEIGISHPLVGKLLLQKWKLPPSIGEAVAYHHNPASKNEADPSRLDISVLIMAANTLTKIARIGFGGESYIHATDQTVWRELPIEEETYVSILSNLSEQIREIKGFFGIKDESPSSPQTPPVSENGETLRLAFYGENDSLSLIPIRLMLRQFFRVESFPPEGDIRSGIERVKPHMVFVDLSSEQRTDKISETMKAYRNVTKSPITLLLSKKVSEETQEKSAKIGIFFLSTPFCPDELSDCLGQMNLVA
jgi:putative nucleotidyltransferase with HDIG domain